MRYQFNCFQLFRSHFVTLVFAQSEKDVKGEICAMSISPYSIPAVERASILVESLLTTKQHIRRTGASPAFRVEMLFGNENHVGGGLVEFREASAAIDNHLIEVA